MMTVNWHYLFSTISVLQYVIYDVSGLGYDVLCRKRKYVLWITFNSMRFENLFHERKQYQK
jgi:hypothetical protein